MKNGRIATIILCLVLCYIIIPTVYAEDVVDVHFRVVIDDPYEHTMCQVSLYQYANMHDTSPIDMRSFVVYDSKDWEATLQLSPGFYKVNSAVCSGSWDDLIQGDTPHFEVKQTETGTMTVYICAENEKNQVVHPENWLIYGEDEKDYHIWDGNGEDDTSDTSDDTDVSTEDLPGDVDTDTSETSGPNRDPKPDISSPLSTQPNDDEPTSVKVGNWIWRGFAIIALIAAFIIWKKTSKWK